MTSITNWRDVDSNAFTEVFTAGAISDTVTSVLKDSLKGDLSSMARETLTKRLFRVRERRPRFMKWEKWCHKTANRINQDPKRKCYVEYQQGRRYAKCRIVDDNAPKPITALDKAEIAGANRAFREE